MDSSAIVPCALIVIGVICIVQAIPMIKGKVARNRYYGFRTKLTLSSDETWYTANRIAGQALVVWAAINVAAGTIGLFFLPLSYAGGFILLGFPATIIILCFGMAIWVQHKFGAR